MSDAISLTSGQMVNGIAVLLSFFLGYKYAVKRNCIDETKLSSSSKSDSPAEASPEHVFTNALTDFKMVLVVRNDLKMGKGKIGAQCGHAAVGAFEKALKYTPALVRAWQNSGCAKIALRVDNENQLMGIKRAAAKHNLTTCLVVDAGRTQIEPNTKTVLAIGPSSSDSINIITGHLKLL